ncbi:MAG: glycosyltransferase [Hyphomicrobiales bacterium]|nr:glycosyltransferase [Hyphomicrobiales bacterium]
MIAAAISFVPPAIWAYLLLARGWFWCCRERDDTAEMSAIEACFEAGSPWPKVVAVLPARDEAELIAQSLGSLLRQDYPGGFSIVIVDDQSSDDTAGKARATAWATGSVDRLRILAGSNLPAGWTGKLWAMRQGLLAVETSDEPPQFVLFSDADIAYAPRVLRRLVAIACFKRSVLTSLMVKLNCESAAENWLVPAFIFFFQKLYPFAWVNDARRATAAAAGGCMLVRRDALALAGGLEALRGALIDDCALGALMKRQGPIWLGLSEQARSLRRYPALADIRWMVAHSAFAQLRYSPLRLAGTLIGMITAYLLPPLFILFGHGAEQMAGAIAWTLMALCFVPTLLLYGRRPWSALALPGIAALYSAFTVDSAVQHWRGRGGHWKGRFQASPKKAGGA